MPDTSLNDTITMSRTDYEALLDRLEDAEDLTALAEARAERVRLGDEAYYANALPIELVERMIEGEHPIRIWREHRGLTLREMAEKTGLKYPYLSEIETGKKRGSINAYMAIAQALGVEIDTILYERGQ